MPQMAPMLWMTWMCLFWIITFGFVLVNYFTGGALMNKMFPQPKSKIKLTRAQRCAMKMKRNSMRKSKFAKIMDEFMNE